MASLPLTDRCETRRFTVDEVLRMVEVGILSADDPCELLDGELVAVSPQGPDHAMVIGDLTQTLMLMAHPDFTVRVQSPGVASSHSLPEPDLMVVPRDGPWRAERRHPRCDEAVLAIEVVVTTRAEAARKAPIYAAAGAPELWVVDVPRRSITIHRGPTPDGTWRRIEIVDGADAELVVPTLGGAIRLVDVLPPG